MKRNRDERKSQEELEKYERENRKEEEEQRKNEEVKVLVQVYYVRLVEKGVLLVENGSFKVYYMMKMLHSL